MKIIKIIFLVLMLSGCNLALTTRDIGSLEGQSNTEDINEELIKSTLKSARTNLVKLGYRCREGELGSGWHITKGEILSLYCGYRDEYNYEDIYLDIEATFKDIEVYVKETENTYQSNLYTITDKERNLTTEGIKLLKQTFINIYPDMKINIYDVKSTAKASPMFQNEEVLLRRVGMGFKTKEISEDTFFASYYGYENFSIDEGRTSWYEEVDVLCPHGIAHEVIYLSKSINLAIDYNSESRMKNAVGQSFCDASSSVHTNDIASAFLATLLICSIDLVTSKVTTYQNTYPVVEGLVSCKK